MPQKIISLKNQKEFDAVNHAGKKFVGKFMIVVVSNPGSKQASHLGLKVGRKFGNAVIRNKFKRRIRAIVYDFSKSHNGCSFIVIPKSYAAKADYPELEKDFNKICKSANY
jgi:ribonuclease P protein component